jgi:hypothetical protein
MWAMIIVMADILVQHHGQMPFTGDQQPVGALRTYRADPPLGDRVRPRRLRRHPDHIDPNRGEHRVERGSELAVPISGAETAADRLADPGP